MTQISVECNDFSRVSIDSALQISERKEFADNDDFLWEEGHGENNGVLLSTTNFRMIMRFCDHKQRVEDNETW
jgi:hypothetical protein